MATTTIRLFGLLHTHRRDLGLHPNAEVELPEEGITAREVAINLELPLDKIEAVIVNHSVLPLSTLLHPGDRVAYASRGIPGPHRYTLGLYAAGKADESA